MVKKILIVLCCILFMSGVAFAEYTIHSGRTGTGSSSYGHVGDSTHVWGEGWFNELHYPHRIPIQLGSVTVDGGNDIDDGSTPALSTADNVGAILYDDSSETTEIQFNWSPSNGYVSGMQLQVLISSSVADGTTKYLDWSVFVQDDATAFGTATAQTGAACTGSAINTKNGLITLTLNSTAEALITAGSSVVTVALWNSGLTGDTGTTEIKAITILEP